MSYDRVLDALDEHGLDFTEVDRILLNEDAYDNFLGRVSGARISNRTTMEAPAVRLTEGQEKLVYVDDDGYPVEIEL